ncbi:MAG: hypothetical protein ACLQAH_09060 [Limisphaerales bacterium]
MLMLSFLRPLSKNATKKWIDLNFEGFDAAKLVEDFGATLTAKCERPTNLFRPPLPTETKGFS